MKRTDLNVATIEEIAEELIKLYKKEVETIDYVIESYRLYVEDKSTSGCKKYEVNISDGTNTKTIAIIEDGVISSEYLKVSLPFSKKEITVSAADFHACFKKARNSEMTLVNVLSEIKERNDKLLIGCLPLKNGMLKFYSRVGLTISTEPVGTSPFVGTAAITDSNLMGFQIEFRPKDYGACYTVDVIKICIDKGNLKIEYKNKVGSSSKYTFDREVFDIKKELL